MALLLDDLLVAPVKLLVDVCRKVRDMAEEEAYGEDNIKQQLIELQMKLEMEEITEAQYLEAEAALMQRLEVGRRRRGEGEVSDH